jgi:hypothetical protein
METICFWSLIAPAWFPSKVMTLAQALAQGCVEKVDLADEDARGSCI